MSSLTRETGARTGYRLRLYTAHGRKSIWLGEVSRTEATATQRHVDEIIAAQTAGLPIPRQTQHWLETLNLSLRAKLMPLLGSAKTVSAMIDAFIDHKSQSVKSSTLASIENSLNSLSAEAGSLLVQSVERHHLDAIRDGLCVADSTQAKFAKDWRAFFAWCIEQNASTHNPADHLATHVHAANKQFIARETIAKALEQCQDNHLAAVIALSRYGGLRIPSEIYTLGASDVGDDRIRITDTKRTSERFLPIFPELADHLESIRGLSESTIATLSPSGITSRFEQLLREAKITPWPKLWHSMRASRETELIREFGITTACLWIGNSPTVAAKHYAQVSPDDWQRATTKSHL